MVCQELWLIHFGTKVHRNSSDKKYGVNFFYISKQNSMDQDKVDGNEAEIIINNN